MMVGRVLCNRSSQLGNLDISFIVPLETCEHDLSLSWFEAIHHAGDGAFVVHVREENKLLVDEVRVGDGTGRLSVEERLVETILPSLSPLLKPICQPFLAGINTFLAEGLNSV